MKVWVLIEIVPEVPEDVIGVFSSQEAAEKARGMWQNVHGPFEVDELKS